MTASGLHVALISFGYPPMRHVAGTRAARMAKELVRSGNRVTVFTLDWRSEARGAEYSVEDGVLVARANPRNWYPAFDPNASPIVLETVPTPSVVRRARTFGRTLRWGPFAVWAKQAFEQLRARHREEPVSVVWAIHGDPSAHEIAFRFQREAGVPWVADFKDPWDMFHEAPFARAVQFVATSRRLRSAACLTETSKRQASSDAARFRQTAHVVWSGYDAELMESVPPKRYSDSFVVAHVGHLSQQHDRPTVARFVAALRDKCTAKVEVHIFGHTSKEMAKIFADHGVGNEVVQHSFVSQAEAYAAMKGADALLLVPATHFAPSGASVGVKELEYFASGTPVLCLGGLLPEIRAVADDLAQTMIADSIESALSFINTELGARKERTPSPRRTAVNTPSVRAYGWEAQGALLERVLRQVAESRQGQ